MKPEPTKRARNGWRGMLAGAAAIAIAASPAAAWASPNQTLAAESRQAVISQPMEISGVRVSLPALNIDGNVYIALRSLNDQLGLQTSWDPDKRTATVSGRGRRLTLGTESAGVAEYTLNGQRAYGMASIVQDGSTYVPLRFLLERMGFDITYDAASRVVGIHAIQENELKIENRTIKEEADKQTLLVNYPQITGFAKQDIQQKINAFLQQEAEAHAASDKASIAKAAAENKAAEENSPEITIPPVSFESGYTVTYNEQGKLSLYTDYYSYLGGAHGSTERVPYTFDLSTGSLISLKEAASNKADYVTIINEAIQSQIRESDLMLLVPFQTIEPDRPFFLKHNGIVVYFNQYEYTPYAAGMPEFEIPFGAFR